MKKIHLQSLSLTESDFQLQWQSNSFDAIGGKYLQQLYGMFTYTHCVYVVHFV